MLTARNYLWTLFLILYFISATYFEIKDTNLLLIGFAIFAFLSFWEQPLINKIYNNKLKSIDPNDYRSANQFETKLYCSYYLFNIIVSIISIKFLFKFINL